MATNTADLPRFFTVEEVRVALRIGKRQALDLVHTGRLRSVRVGEKSHRIRIPESALIDFMNSGQRPAIGQGPCDAATE